MRPGISWGILGYPGVIRPIRVNLVNSQVKLDATNDHPMVPHDTSRQPLTLNYFIDFTNYMTKLRQSICFVYQNLFPY